MSLRLKQWTLVGLLGLAGVTVLLVSGLPCLPLVNGTTTEEVDRLVEWLELESGARVADLGAGEGTYTIALARRVGPSGHVYATEIDEDNLDEIRQAKAAAGLSNITVIEGEAAATNLPEDCCDAVFSRNVYHHLTDSGAINADIYRALHSGGRLMVIDFEPGGFMDWIGRSETTDRHGGHGTPKETVLEEVPEAGFELVRGPESWRGRTYAVLFRRP